MKKLTILILFILLTVFVSAQTGTSGTYKLVTNPSVAFGTKVDTKTLVIDWKNNLFYKLTAVAKATDSLAGVAKTLIGSSLTGSGTAGNLTRWTASGTIGNSIIKDDTSTVSIGSTSIGKTLNVYATDSTELAPTCVPSNWDALPSGWAYTSPNRIAHNSAGTGAATPTATTNIRAGCTYKVTIVVDSFPTSGGGFTWSLGGITNLDSIKTAGTYANYITTTGTSKISISPSTGDRFYISSVSIKAQTLNTGNTYHCGRTYFYSPTYFMGGANVFGNIIPMVNNTYNLGSSSNYFSYGYILNLSSAGGGLTGYISLTGLTNQNIAITVPRRTTLASAGTSFIVTAAGSTAGSTNKSGGNIILTTGVGTGNTTSFFEVQTPKPTTSGTSDGVIQRREIVYTRYMADNDTIKLDDGRSGMLWLLVGDNEEYAWATFTSTAVVTLIHNSTNITTTGATDNKVNIYDGGAMVIVEQTFSAAKQVTIKVLYNL